MTELVADTSALVSVGIAADIEWDPVAALESSYELFVPDVVYRELHDVASYEDDHGHAATNVLERLSDDHVRSVALDPGFPLDDGENAAVSLANERDAALLLCDEFNSLGLVHASLADTRLVTTPTLLSVFVRHERLTRSDALALLDSIAVARSWGENSYVQRARSRLEND